MIRCYCILCSILLSQVGVLQAQIPRPDRAPRLPNPPPPLLQDDVYFPAHPWLVVRTAIGTVTDFGSLEITAVCESGETLLGGGYVLPTPPLSGAAEGNNPLIIEASYPAGSDRWTVIADNPNTAGTGSPFGAAVRVEAYCLTKPIATIQVISSPTVTMEFGTPPVPIDARCPSGSVATAGGYRTSHTMPYAGLYNSWVWGSAPELTDDRQTLGWRVEQTVMSWLGPPSPPSTTAYAICAAPNPVALRCLPAQPGGRRVLPCESGTITAGTAVSGAVSAVDSFGYTYFEGDQSCSADEVTIGGGYRFEGDSIQHILIPHSIYRTALAAPFTGGWQIGGVSGRGMMGFATCLKLPPVYLTVRILSPADRSAPPLAPTGAQGGPPDKTDFITFAAIAGDGTGALVSDATFEWTIDGAPLGTGENVTTTLPASQCTIVDRHVQVTATDGASHTATDAITLYIGGVC